MPQGGSSMQGSMCIKHKCECATTPGPGTGDNCDNCDTSWEKKVGDREGVLYYPNYPYFTVHCRLSPLRWHALRIYQKICQSLSSGQQLTHSHLVTGAGVLSVLCWQSGVCWVSALTFTWTSEYNDTHTSTLPASGPDTTRYCSHYPICKYTYCPNSELCHPLLCEAS